MPLTDEESCVVVRQIIPHELSRVDGDIHILISVPDIGVWLDICEIYSLTLKCLNKI
jgi:hypothetical protein